MKGLLLKNYQKLVFLGATVIMSSQPSLVGASEFFSSDTQDQFQVRSEAGEEASSDFQIQQNLPKVPVRLGNLPIKNTGSPGYTPPFNVYRDVTQYKNHILWLTATTVTNGTAPYYNPNGKVTRGADGCFSPSYG